MSLLLYMLLGLIHMNLFEQASSRVSNIFWYLGRYIARMGFLLLMIDWILSALDPELAMFERMALLLWMFGLAIGWFGRVTHRTA